MSFFRNQQINLAMKLLTWKYQRDGRSVPPTDQLKTQAVGVVDEATRIAKERGQNIAGILKELVGDLKK
jgi:hypothetical protein